MEHEINSVNKRSDSWKLFERFGVIIALVASLATVVGLLLQVRSEKRGIELKIISADQLTRLPSVSGLEGAFTYNKIPVTDLWRLRVEFVNSGDTTLIGEGAASSLMTSSIPITFPPSVNILNASSETDSFYKLTQSSANTIDIEFSQWRPGEKFETLIYLSSNSVLEFAPLPAVANRPIINGDVVITDLTVRNSIQPQPVINYISPSLGLVGKILGGIVAIIVGGISFGWLVIMSPLSYFRVQYWKYKYFDSFQKHLENVEFTELEESKMLLKKPWLLGLFVGDIIKAWKDFGVPPAPRPSFETFWETMAGFAVGIILTASSIAILASMIII